MRPKKPDRSVSRMDVLKDIRGLLSASQERESVAEARSEAGGVAAAEIARLEGELSHYKGLAQGQQAALERLESENKELTARLNRPGPAKAEPESPAPGGQQLRDEIAGLEATQAELAAALAEINSLLEMKTKDLLKRIARVFEEAAQGDIALEFRRGARDLEVLENLAHFVRALLNE